MSLKHILNDEPSSPVHRPSYFSQPQPAPVGPPSRESGRHSPQESYQPSRGQSSHHRSELVSELPPPGVGAYAQQGYDASRWRSAPQDRWGQSEVSLGGPSNAPDVRYIHEQNGSTSPDWSRSRAGQHYASDERRASVSPARKRHRVSEPVSPIPRRASPAYVRKPPSHYRDPYDEAQYRRDIPSQEQRPRPVRLATDEEAHGATDLEDCEEIWAEDVKHYKAERERRSKFLEESFTEQMKARSSNVARERSHYYTGKLDTMPPPPPSPPPIGPSFYDNPHPPTSYEYAEPPIPPHTEPDPPIQTPVRATLDMVANASQGRRKGRAADHAADAGEPTSTSKPRKSRKRKLEEASNLDNNGPLETTAPMESVSAPVTKSKGKAKVDKEEGPSEPDISEAPPKPPRKKAVRRKQQVPTPALAEQETPVSSPPKANAPLPSPPPAALTAPPAPTTASADATPSASRATSPAPINSGFIFEIGEETPPLKKAKKMDDTTMLKRVKTLEEAQKKVWTNIARKEVAKVHKHYVAGNQVRLGQAERLAKLSSIQARRPITRTTKSAKDTQTKAKRLMREMQVFWKRNEKEERDVRKREHKEALDRQKIEEEKRETSRQARKLEFLISQTELYSHFVGNKLKTSEVEGELADKSEAPAGADVADAPANSLKDIDFDDEDRTNLYQHARLNAQEAVAAAKAKAAEFDARAALERRTNEALAAAKSRAPSESEGTGTSTGLVDLDSDELNFQNPTSLGESQTVAQPKMLTTQLKEYQLKGLTWLATLYEQGINGILADEMGLGKTVQSISLLTYLAETHDIWGPFLVVAPASTLHNWQQEISRFVPKLKALPYWGNVKDRATLRKFWSKKEISYNEDAPFHILITSYQLVTQDQQYFQRVKWQYMILDEAQNIKNSSSARWKTLLGFHCRNRLLLTGTPIQNSMQELWALLHFIMPSLFDSHDEFNEWFSKDIESAAENKGSKMSEHQLRRLHMILKPFMLRRVKRHVQNELSEKIERDIYVDLSARQRSLYKALLSRVSVADLLAKAANSTDVDSARTLMNLVMQFRKVCNHPELFERADVKAPFTFAHFGRSGPLAREGDFLLLPDSSRNPIEVSIPEIMYRNGGLLRIPQENSLSSEGCLAKLQNIWSTEWIHRTYYEQNSFSFLRFIDTSPQEAHWIHVSPMIRRQALTMSFNQTIQSKPKQSIVTEVAHREYSISSGASGAGSMASELSEISALSWRQSCLSRPYMHWYSPAAVAPPIQVHCNDRSLLELKNRLKEDPLTSLALYGLPHSQREFEECCEEFRDLFPGLHPSGLLNSSPLDQVPVTNMQVPEGKRLIYDSAKLARLDTLLQELKAGDHRVLVYFQMTRMMDLMEEYLIYRQYKYLRLDGSSKIEDRRDMVMDWQTKPEIFVFLLSTRAGGLGINLTAADTVVFYDHDWNPSNDAQAMDRAHRLGQTRQVTVYRLITKGTIDERIIQLARVKKDVQDIVVGNKTIPEVAKPSEIAQLLLNDEQLADMDLNMSASAGSDPPGKDAALWNATEEDDFFGHNGPTASSTPVVNEMGDDEASTGASTPARGRKRKEGTTRGRGGRRRGAGRKSGVTTQTATPVGELA